jgi:hypothetical protein|tara:strand:+ start:214 stop:369 length:156 start_codon:yes stop_codon:yes gene_type:complete
MSVDEVYQFYKFALVSTSNILNNLADHHIKGPFDENLARNTGRFALKPVEM